MSDQPETKPKPTDISQWFKENEREVLYCVVFYLGWKNRRRGQMIRALTKQLSQSTDALNEAATYLKALEMIGRTSKSS